ncbi:MAG TPA: FAD-binding oxidoreductase [Steroidobacteraceae bacterium]|nr:FAD-binding oxidoreductase [Steroidobacteraceae bacterium]
MSLKPADSWYEVTARRGPAQPSLEGDVEADVCVVGGGLSGCSTALHLAERGYKVVLLEAERVGYGASGRSGGQIIPGYACGMGKLAAQLGPGDAKRLWDYSVEGVDVTRDLILRHDIDCDLTWGHIHAAIRPRQREELLEWQREQEGDYGYRKLRFMEKAEVGDWVATDRYIAGLYDAGAGHLHPLRYTIGVGQAAMAAGVRLHEGSAVTDIRHGPTATVRTAKGSVRAKFVALCANVGHVDLSRRLAGRLIGVASYIVATKPLGPERARALLKDNVAVADLNWIIDYFRLSSDHRLLFGGRVSYSGLDPLGTARATRLRMLRVFPQLADVEIDYAWGGMIDITMSRAPDFGRLEPNVYYLQGYSGHGMVATTIAGKILAETIAGQSERFDVFARLKHHAFPGGKLLRRPTLVMAMTWFRLRDLMP